ncbi:MULTISPECIES: hypothetical protein [Cyanophyceae]|uniref:hypothetical protein n=1 Tax=Cyanophyceae TaxID=3028117 RepID=UPI001F54D6F5|nr:hypothetical protein [Trichocoleus sp. FACHB-40]
MALKQLAISTQQLANFYVSPASIFSWWGGHVAASGILTPGSGIDFRKDFFLAAAYHPPKSFRARSFGAVPQ